jgi:hypothetical protein
LGLFMKGVRSVSEAAAHLAQSLDARQIQELLSLVPLPRDPQPRAWLDRIIGDYLTGPDGEHVIKDIARTELEPDFMRAIHCDAGPESRLWEAELILMETKRLVTNRAND